MREKDKFERLQRSLVIEKKQKYELEQEKHTDELLKKQLVKIKVSDKNRRNSLLEK